MLGSSANKALITGINLVISAFLVAKQAHAWVPTVNTYGEKWMLICKVLVKKLASK